MTLKQKIHSFIEKLIQYLQSHTSRRWYTWLVGFLAFIDYFVIVIPTDGILISSVMLRSKKWFYLAISTTLGSTLGALVLFYLVKTYGLDWILNIYPHLTEGAVWNWTINFFDTYGIFLVFFVAATPFVQQPVIALAALSHTPFLHIFAAVLLGRLIKYLIIAYVTSHSPHLISKLWGVKEELDEVGIHINSKIQKPK